MSHGSSTPPGDGPPETPHSWPPPPDTGTDSGTQLPAADTPVADEQSGYSQPSYGQAGQSPPSYGQSGPAQPSYGQSVQDPGQPGYALPPGYGNDPQSYGQPQYGVQPGAPEQKSNGLAIAALVLGILALLTCWIPILGPLLGLVAIILGIIALRRRRGGRGLAITGIVLGALFLVIGVVFSIGWYIAFTVAQDCADETGETAGPVFEQCLDDRVRDIGS